MRDLFLSRLAYFDNNFNLIIKGDGGWDDMMRTDESFNQRVRAIPHFQMRNHIDISRVKQITLLSSDKNCFEPFYNLQEEMLMFFFETLSEVELCLKMHDDFVDKYRDVRESNRNQSKQKKIQEVIDMMESDPTYSEKTIIDLQHLHRSLNNNHFTKRQIFQHLLFFVAFTTNNLRQGRSVTKTTNQLIKYYFGEDITFTRAENIKKYTPRSYIYITQKPFILYHS